MWIKVNGGKAINLDWTEDLKVVKSIDKKQWVLSVWFKGAQKRYLIEGKKYETKEKADQAFHKILSGLEWKMEVISL